MQEGLLGYLLITSTGPPPHASLPRVAHFFAHVVVLMYMWSSFQNSFKIL